MQIIRRGILQSFSASSYTASVLLMEATSTFLVGVPCSTAIDGTSAQPGAFCAVLFFDEQNVQDAVVVAVYPNGSQGVPSPPPGRVTLLASPFVAVNAAVINAGVTSTYTLTGGGSGIPSGVIAVLADYYYTSPTVGAWIIAGPHGATLTGYPTLGTLALANGYINGSAIVPVDVSGKIDIKATTGNCTVTLYTYGYVI